MMKDVVFLNTQNLNECSEAIFDIECLIAKFSEMGSEIYYVDLALIRSWNKIPRMVSFWLMGLKSEPEQVLFLGGEMEILPAVAACYLERHLICSSFIPNFQAIK